MLSDFTTCLQDFRRLEASDEFPVAGDEEAGAGGDFFAGCVGDHQQHDGGAGFEVDGLGFGEGRWSDGKVEDGSADPEKRQGDSFHGARIFRVLEPVKRGKEGMTDSRQPHAKPRRPDEL